MAIQRARLFAKSHELGALSERNRLAREIHDTLAQGLTAITRQLETADVLIDAQAEAEHAVIKLMIKSTEIHLQIADDGLGFEVKKVASGHYGLIGLQERAKLLGGISVCKLPRAMTPKLMSISPINPYRRGCVPIFSNITMLIILRMVAPHGYQALHQFVQKTA